MSETLQSFGSEESKVKKTENFGNEVPRNQELAPRRREGGMWGMLEKVSSRWNGKKEQEARATRRAEGAEERQVQKLAEIRAEMQAPHVAKLEELKTQYDNLMANGAENFAEAMQEVAVQARAESRLLEMAHGEAPAWVEEVQALTEQVTNNLPDAKSEKTENNVNMAENPDWLTHQMNGGVEVQPIELQESDNTFPPLASERSPVRDADPLSGDEIALAARDARPMQGGTLEDGGDIGENVERINTEIPYENSDIVQNLSSEKSMTEQIREAHAETAEMLVGLQEVTQRIKESFGEDGQTTQEQTVEVRPQILTNMDDEKPPVDIEDTPKDNLDDRSGELEQKQTLESTENDKNNPYELAFLLTTGAITKDEISEEQKPQVRELLRQMEEQAREMGQLLEGKADETKQTEQQPDISEIKQKAVGNEEPKVPEKVAEARTLEAMRKDFVDELNKFEQKTNVGTVEPKPVEVVDREKLQEERTILLQKLEQMLYFNEQDLKYALELMINGYQSEKNKDLPVKPHGVLVRQVRALAKELTEGTDQSVHAEHLQALLERKLRETKLEEKLQKLADEIKNNPELKSPQERSQDIYQYRREGLAAALGYNGKDTIWSVDDWTNFANEVKVAYAQLYRGNLYNKEDRKLWEATKKRNEEFDKKREKRKQGGEQREHTSLAAEVIANNEQQSEQIPVTEEPINENQVDLPQEEMDVKLGEVMEPPATKADIYGSRENRRKKNKGEDPYDRDDDDDDGKGKKRGKKGKRW